MYEKDKNIPLIHTASALPNNLICTQVENKRYLGVIHKNVVQIVSTSSSMAPKQVSPGISTNTSYIIQILWVHLVEEHVILVMCTTLGVFFYEWDGSLLLYSHTLPTPGPRDVISFTRGIAQVNSYTICVGVHTGEVLIIKARGDSTLYTERKVKWHDRPITCMDGRSDTLVVADDAGFITVAHSDAADLKQKFTIGSYGTAVTSLKIWEAWVLTGYLSGHIRIFSVMSGAIIAEICGHARAVNALDVASESGLVISASEDTFVRVWQLTPSGDCPVRHKYSHSHKNTALFGAKFKDSMGSVYFTTGYDFNYISSYVM